MGTALLVMVAGLPRTRGNTDEERAALAEVREQIQPLADELASLADADAGAFDEVMAGYKLPKGTDEEKAARTAAIQQGLRHATSVPLDTVRVVADVAARASIVARLGNRSAVSDIGAALHLLEAAAAGATMNVRINLGSVKDEAFVGTTTSALDGLTGAVAADLADARVQLAA
jgi:formiminotetrahydrofolate cyclodeaminase